MGELSLGHASFTLAPHSQKVADLAFTPMRVGARDASLVACSDEAEVDRIRKGFASKMLGLDAAESDKVIKQVCEKMKADKTKHRVTFYYLMAEASGKVGALA